MERMRAFAMEEGQRLGLTGVYFLPWTIHTISQKANEHFGAKLCSVNLSDTSPISIKGFEEESLAQRVSTLLYYMPLKPLERRTIYAPKGHHKILALIYDNLGVAYAFGETSHQLEGTTSLSVTNLPHDQFAELRVLQPGFDFSTVLRHQLREQLIHHSCETIYLNLPLDCPATAEAIDQAEAQGFSFLGIGPCFAEQGDMLRMAYMTEPLDPNHIHALSPLGQELVQYALAERMRVTL